MCWGGGGGGGCQDVLSSSLSMALCHILVTVHTESMNRKLFVVLN